MNRRITTGAGTAVIIIVFVLAAILILWATMVTREAIRETMLSSQTRIGHQKSKKSAQSETAGKACLDSGGTVSSALCCGQIRDFPDNCAIGACGCAPSSSHEVKTCECGKEKCFDGTKCIDVRSMRREGEGNSFILQQ